MSDIGNDRIGVETVVILLGETLRILVEKLDLDRKNMGFGEIWGSVNHGPLHRNSRDK